MASPAGSTFENRIAGLPNVEVRLRTEVVALEDGVFPIGDVRAGSTKRVAAADGEGAQATATIHAFLAGGRERVGVSDHGTL
jgi:thioredoxin reductase